MKPETEQLLGTLEVLIHQPFLWKTEPQGEFNVWNLMISEGFVSLTDSELAFEHWQNIERWGTPTDQQVLEYEYAPSRSERKDDWNEAIATQRQEYYQQLQQFLSTELQNTQAYSLSIPNFSRNSFEWTHPDFWVSIIVSETCDHQWVCLAPTVPDHIFHRRRSKDAITSSSDPNQALPSPISSILDKLNPISIYGYYHGGYNYSYLHQIVGAIAKNKTSAIELALQAAQMVIREKPTMVEYVENSYDSRKLSQFMNQCLRDRTRYSISFWDIGYTYEVGQVVTGDWLGISSTTEFEYNP